MKVLVLGGTGAIGRHLVDILASKGNTVVVTSRKKHNIKSNVEYIIGDAHNVEFIKSILQKNRYDAIVDFMSYKTEEFCNRYQLFLRSCNQYVFLSSARVYANVGNNLITEQTPRLLDVCKNNEYLKTDEYALTKARQEDLLFECKEKNWTIIRPYITYSETRLQLGVLEKEFWLYRALQGKSIVFSKDIMENYTTLTYGKDVSAAIYSLLGKKEAMGEAFHITGEDTLKWKDILRIYINAIEETTGIIPEVILTEKSTRLKYPEAKWQVIYDRYFNRRFDNHKIGKFFDLQSFKKTEEGLAQCLKLFIHSPQYNVINWKSEAYFDSLCNEYATTSDIKNTDKIIYNLYRRMPCLIYLDIIKQFIKMSIKG